MIVIAHITNRGRFGRCAALAGIMFVVAVLAQWASSTSARAAPSPSSMNLAAPYSYSGCGGHWVDPINVVWSGFYTSPHYNTVVTAIEAWAGWWTQDGNTPPYVVDNQWTTHVNGSCTQDLQQQADGCPFCNRRHVRIMYANGSYLVGDAHYDDTVWCGGPAHKASTFDGPENDLVTAWRTHGGTANYGWWGNTRHMRQCDGSYTWASGYPAFMSP